MSELLQKALAEVSRLSEEEQDAVAAIILDVLEDERQWEAAFAASQDQLAKLAEKVREDIRSGRVRETGLDDL
jgi:hypothetical protein